MTMQGWSATCESVRHIHGVAILHGGPEPACIAEHAHVETQVTVHFRPSSRSGPGAVPTDVHLYAPQQPHSGGWPGGWKVVVFHLSPELLTETAEELSSAVRFEIRPFNAHRERFLEVLARVVLNEIHAAERVAPFYIESIGHLAAGHLLRNHAGTHPRTHRENALSGSQLKSLRGFIEERIESGFTVLELANSVGLRPQRFAHQLRLASGMSPWRFVQAQRLMIARRMLRDRRLALADIASRLGFTDQSHFTNVFHTSLGITPNSYRKAL